MKYRVKKTCTLLYPDGSPRGDAGYIVDGDLWTERNTLRDQGDKLERVPDRQTPASPVDLSRMAAPEQAVEDIVQTPEDGLEEGLVRRVLRKRKKVAKKKSS